MSEYQYYEFRAIDRPLTSEDQKYLRSISSRGEISATSFTNDYQWGDFKGDPLKLMHRCFDLHVYYANWASRTLMLRVPAKALAGVPVKAFENDFLRFRAQESHVVVHWEFSADDFDEDFDIYDRDWAAELLPIRNLLLSGDTRALYLGWLAGVAYLDPADQPEPPVPPGLNDLSDELNSLVEFLGISEEWLAVAAERSERLAADETDIEAQSKEWLASLPPSEKDRYLLLLLQGEQLQARLELQAAFRDQTAGTAAIGVSTGRTIKELHNRVSKLEEERLKAEAEEKARRQERAATAAAKARKDELQALAQRYEAAWGEVEKHILLGSSHYGDAVRLILNLREAEQFVKGESTFAARLATLEGKYQKRYSLMDLIKKKIRT